MAKIKLVFLFITVLISVVIHRYINKDVREIADVEKCPYCYGLDYCDKLFSSNATLKKSTISDFFNNFISAKNVFVTNDNVILKKLASNIDLTEFDGNCDITREINASEIITYLSHHDFDRVYNFRVCSGVNIFFRNLLDLKPDGTEITDYYKNLWTIFHLNVEPLILQILKSEDNWPVPKYYGACGRLIVQEHCGSNLNNYQNYEWLDRANLAMQLLQAAFNFTESHKVFQFYLTDASPDNVVVDEKMKIKFIDLENVLIKDKTGVHQHTSEIYMDEEYAYSEQEICSSYRSDHNYFTICKLLLSKNAPWPMMQGGLLHSIPLDIEHQHPDLEDLIEHCVKPSNGNTRFNISKILIKKLHNILNQYHYKK